jgi:hypothetical protein
MRVARSQPVNYEGVRVPVAGNERLGLDADIAPGGSQIARRRPGDEQAARWVSLTDMIVQHDSLQKSGTRSAERRSTVAFAWTAARDSLLRSRDRSHDGPDRDALAPGARGQLSVALTSKVACLC